MLRFLLCPREPTDSFKLIFINKTHKKYTNLKEKLNKERFGVN